MADFAQHGGYDENAEASQFDRLPAGTYKAAIQESDIVDVSDKEDKGRCLKLTWKLMGGAFDGRLFWQRITLYAENMKNVEKVREIANQQFAAIRQATGKAAPKNSEELHGIPCMITIGPQKDSDKYDEVKSVRAVEAGGQAPARQEGKTQTSGTTQRTNHGTGGNAKPWGNRASA